MDCSFLFLQEIHRLYMFPHLIDIFVWWKHYLLFVEKGLWICDVVMVKQWDFLLIPFDCNAMVMSFNAFRISMGSSLIVYYDTPNPTFTTKIFLRPISPVMIIFIRICFLNRCQRLNHEFSNICLSMQSLFPTHFNLLFIHRIK